jgi:hypothetical protein
MERNGKEALGKQEGHQELPSAADLSLAFA